MGVRTMSEWFDVARRDEIPPGGCKAVEAGGRSIAVVNLDGEFYAIDNLCTHEHAELSDGWIFGDEIECPLHGARFNIRTGQATAPPAYEPLRTYPVRIENEVVKVRLES